jgi:hypothetical protein
MQTNKRHRPRQLNVMLHDQRWKANKQFPWRIMERLSVWSTHGNLYCMHPDSSSAIRGLIQSQSNLTCDALIFTWCETQSEKRMIVNDHFLYFPRSHEQTQCKHFGKTSKKNNHLHAWEKIYRHWIYNDEIFEPSIVFSSWQRVLLNSLDLLSLTAFVWLLF